MLLAVSLLGGCNPASGEDAMMKTQTKPATGAVAVVELFTSEGCSSCPPADAALADLVRESATSKLPVFAIAHHVDYWNRLGWADPFSTASASRRQAIYSQTLGTEAYTPQVIVNGATDVLGSDRRRLAAAVNASLARPASTTVDLKAQLTPKESIAVDYAVSSAAQGAVLNVAVVESGLSTQVPRGENAGRTLRHEHVARAFVTVPIDASKKGSVNVPLPPGVRRDQLTVIAFVQDGTTLAVKGAAAATPLVAP